MRLVVQVARNRRRNACQSLFRKIWSRNLLGRPRHRV